MSEKRFRVMTNDSKQLYYIESVDGEMFSMQEIVDLLNEQQDTINKLQDLCGESDSENAKLSEENEQLREELSECDKFRHSVFKRMNELTDQLKEKEEDEKLYAEEILKLREINQFNELGGDY